MVHVDLDACGLDKGGVMGVATVTGFAVVMGYTGRVYMSCISHYSVEPRRTWTRAAGRTESAMGRAKVQWWELKQGEENGGMGWTGNPTIDQRPEANDEVTGS